MVLSTNRFHHEYQAYTELRRSHWDNVHAKRYQDEKSYYRKCLESIYGRLVTPGSKVLEFGCGNGRLLASLNPSYGLGIDFSEAALSQARQAYPNLLFINGDAHTHIKIEALFDYVIVSDLVNDLWDIQSFLKTLKMYCSHETRVIFNFHSHLWNVPLSIARTLRLATPVLPQNWLTKHDLENFLKISDFESLSQWSEITIPINLGRLSRFYNRFFAKLWPFRHLNLANFIVARAAHPTSRNSRPSVSVVVAARNEAGHIDELIRRIPYLGREAEIIFIEGHSKDNTYEVIEAAKESYPEKKIKLLKQSGRGKGDAIRTGFSHATGDILIILDADISVAPEDMTLFYELLASGKAEFINGVRLVYPMQEDAMRFINLIGNKFFAWSFSWMLGQPIRDTLCGTKALWAKDYQRLSTHRAYFGDFDPFGDFDLLFGAARLNLHIMEVPVRYRSRTYGETNISRWRHGWLLLKMVIFAARKIKFV